MDSKTKAELTNLHQRLKQETYLRQAANDDINQTLVRISKGVKNLCDQVDGIQRSIEVHLIEGH